MKNVISLSLFLLFSLLCLPVRAQLNADVDTDTSKWFNRTQRLGEVTVKAKRSRYSRKDNPAVELMRRVIAAKRQTDLRQHDFYQYTRYEKLTVAANDLTPEQLAKKPFANKKWLLDRVEKCQYNGKMILPLSVDETVAQHVYRKSPHDEKTIITGQQSTGINDLFQTGDIVNVTLKDSCYHVRRCALSIPKRSDVNFVENMRVEQDFQQLSNGEWVLTRDDMMTELKLTYRLCGKHIRCHHAQRQVSAYRCSVLSTIWSSSTTGMPR